MRNVKCLNPCPAPKCRGVHEIRKKRQILCDSTAYRTKTSLYLITYVYTQVSYIYQTEALSNLHYLSFTEERGVKGKEEKLYKSVIQRSYRGSY